MFQNFDFKLSRLRTSTQTTHYPTKQSVLSIQRLGTMASSNDRSIDAATLRQLQAPIKDRYKNDPTSALVTLSSQGTLSSTSIACKLSSGPAVKEAHSRVAGLHPAAGGLCRCHAQGCRDSSFRSGDRWSGSC